ncbi:cation-efflux pump [Sporosarcina sp. P37]|uniref:cation diffusion facilitator family transporter n=1 Tax=unclassified Sporosarcina TaxID=2647733 RepID=UPI0009BD14EA|nr:MULTISPECIES: cation diffusion facilitator family transporter [unclassified Sporosarcina]ARD47369.1 cation diffusion facilitator family transporter [Sporosarcina sp. P33]ARK23936.1 cation-efflux pump [Sporosarcina sp. P37]PID17694.1 cation transporter [Sporosarcina sp. P35]
MTTRTQEHSFSSVLAIWISLISNIVLTVLKLIVGFIFKSPVLLADGFHNAGDVVASAAALTSMRISKRPADEDHPYGHGKAEVIGSSIVAIILGLASIYIAFEAVLALFEEPAAASTIALLTAVLSLVWKYVLYVYTIRVGKAENSKGLIATAYDHLADVYASLAAVVGIGLALLGDAYDWPLLAYGDPIAGIIVSILVFKIAMEIGKESVDILMEKSVCDDRLLSFEELICSIPEVKRIDRLRAREHGHYVLVDIRIGVAGDLTIQEGHIISSRLRNLIMAENEDVDEVLIHLNPWYPEK